VNRTEKEQLCNELNTIFQNNTNALVVGFSGLKVNDAAELRLKLREANCSYRVVKNTIAKIAAEGTPMASVVDQFVGITAIAFNESDPVLLAKTFREFFKTHKVFDIKAILVEGNSYPGDQLDAIAAMPTRDELIAKLMSLLNCHLMSLVRVLNAPLRDLGMVLNEIKKES